MSIRHRPHTVTVREDITGKTEDLERELTEHESSGVELVCSIQPMSPSAAFERFGVELGRPYLLLANFPSSLEAAEAKIKTGNLIAGTVGLEAREFIVRAVTPFTVGLVCDHVAAVLEEVTAKQDDE